MNISYQPLSQAASGDAAVDARFRDMAFEFDALEPPTDRHASVGESESVSPENAAHEGESHVPGDMAFKIVHDETIPAAVAHGAKRRRDVGIGKMMEEIIGKRVIDLEIHAAEVSCVGLNEADRRLLAACLTRVAQNARVVVEAEDRALDPQPAAVSGEPEPRVASARGDVEEAYFPCSTSAHIGEYGFTQHPSRPRNKAVDFYEIPQRGEKQAFVARRVVHEFRRYGAP